MSMYKLHLSSIITVTNGETYLKLQGEGITELCS